MELLKNQQQHPDTSLNSSINALQNHTRDKVQSIVNEDIELLFLDLLDEILPEPLEVEEF
jgi:hypothetical protein